MLSVDERRVMLRNAQIQIITKISSVPSDFFDIKSYSCHVEDLRRAINLY